VASQLASILTRSVGSFCRAWSSLSGRCSDHIQLCVAVLEDDGVVVRDEYVVGALTTSVGRLDAWSSMDRSDIGL
jgi:hypothetical protein